MKIAIVGATGLVGREMIKVLESRSFPVSEFIPVASEKSAGQAVEFSGKEYKIVSLADAVAQKPDLAVFSAGAATSLEWAPKFREAGTTVIDNSSAWRMQENIPLVVPEINGNILTAEDKIIANPNCSTIQLVMVLSPLHNRYGIKRVVVSTYQAVSGSGAKGINQLMGEREQKETEKYYPHQIDLNVIPQAGDFTGEDGYTTEEIKLENETKKILNADIKLTATAVRVPVLTGHAEAVNVEFEQDFDFYDLRRLLGFMQGVVVVDMPEGSLYPMPLLAEGQDDVFVGRLRRDFSQPNTLNLWIVADNLRKGAATNAIQIAEYLLNNQLV